MLLDWRLRECDYGVHRFLDELVATRDSGRVLVIGHMATRCGIVTYATGRTLADVLAEEFAWQPGWEYVL